jgi:hypothetical protein
VVDHYVLSHKPQKPNSALRAHPQHTVFGILYLLS